MTEIDGLDRFIRSLQNISDELESTVKQVINQSALQIESDAKRLVPVDTGHLRRSITTALDNGGLSATVGTNVEYALAVEFGTSRQTAQPYLTPAFVQNQNKVIDNLENALRRLEL